MTLFSVRSFGRIMCYEKERKKPRSLPKAGGGGCDLHLVGEMTGPLPLSWEVACSVLTTFSFDFCLGLRFCVELSPHLVDGLI